MQMSSGTEGEKPPARTSSPHISRKKKGKRQVREYESYTKLLNSQPQNLVVQICVQAGIVCAAAATHNNASLRFSHIRPTLTVKYCTLESPSPSARKTLRRTTTRVLLSCGRIYKYSCKLGDEKDIFKNASAYSLTILAALVYYILQHAAFVALRHAAAPIRQFFPKRGQKRSIVVRGVAISVYAHAEANSAILVGRRQRKSTLGSLFEFGYRENLSNQKKRKKKKGAKLYAHALSRNTRNVPRTTRAIYAAATTKHVIS
uniref:Uncharacterized protein n=1 Tax=Trichogramma kaykai TaxID=54128 RepID=A0ABD2W7Y2_9HYME